MIRGLELGSGSQSVSIALRSLGIEMTTIDHDETTNPDVCCKWEDLDPVDYPNINFVWFSPDCICYSVMSFPQGHFKDGVAVTDAAKAADAAVIAGLDFIKSIDPKFWVMENPRALLRKRPFVQDLDRVTVAYCRYGHDRMKPTDLFGVLPVGFEPQMCKNGHTDHIAAPRGSRTGTQGPQTAAERAIVPPALALDIGREIIKEFHGGYSF